MRVQNKTKHLHIEFIVTSHNSAVNSNFTLAVHSPKFGQAKIHFLSHHNACYINRFANFLTRYQGSNG